MSFGREGIVVQAPARMRRLPRAAGFALTVFTFTLLMAQVAAPTPLYSVYQSEWKLSALTMTAIFAVYVLGLLGAMTSLGRLPDIIGRRPMIIAAISVGIVALAILATATSVDELLVGRVLQGVASGAGTSALGAALLDLEPERLLGVAATMGGAIITGGMAVGVMLSGLFLQFLTSPTHTVYVVLIVLSVLACGLLPLLPDDHPRRRARLADLRPDFRVPPAVRPVFLAVVPCMMASWTLGGMYLALGPSIAEEVLAVPGHVAAAAAAATLLAAAATVGSLALRTVTAERAMMGGTVLLVLGPLVTVAAMVVGSVGLFYIGAVVAGAGLGTAYQSGLRVLLLASTSAMRASVLACCFTLIYACFGFPSLIAGALVPDVGLRDVAYGYAAVVACLALLALVLQTRSIPAGKSSRGNGA